MLVVALVALVLTACQPARVGQRCRTTDFGDDGGDWVLQCRNGRWQRMVTKRDVALAIAAQQARNVAQDPASATPPGVDDYPPPWRDAPKDSLFDTWGYPNRQCTSFVAFRLANTNRVALVVRPGDADRWDDTLAPYYRVDGTPAVGAIAQWNANESFGGLGAGPLGHVAWVQAVHPDGSVTVEQYNLGDDGRYVQMRTRAPRYIHVRDL